MERGVFSSRLAFILAASGSAVGLGNIWGFPTNATENGGAAFLLMYLVLAFLLAYPALMAELIIGRHTRSNMVNALTEISSGKTVKYFGRGIGIAGMITASLILSFYAIVAGWMISHMVEPITQSFSPEVSQWLVSDSLLRNILLCGCFIILTALIISKGVEKGIEKWSTRLMPALFVLMTLLIIYVLFQKGAIEGLKHYLVPDFNQLFDSNLIVNAMGQAFFSMSLGVGTMLIYGSYIRADENLPEVGTLVTLADTGVAFLAGLLILPALFVAQEFGVAIYNDTGSLIAGPGLIFQVLPALFDSMGTSGLLIAFIFFLLMSIAAITSSISMLEVPVSYVVEEFKVRRRSATYFISAIIFSISVIICLNFESLFSFVITLTTERAQPLLGALICIFAGWVFSRNKILAEIKNGNDNAEHGIFWKIWPSYVKFVCPVLILIIFTQTI